MFGVILWSDNRSGSAVIWCEDRAELAYYETKTQVAVGQTPSAAACFDAGDLVQFDLSGMSGRRLEVSNLRAANEQRHDMPTTIPANCDTERRARCTRGALAPVVELHSAVALPNGPGGFSRRG